MDKHDEPGKRDAGGAKADIEIYYSWQGEMLTGEQVDRMFGHRHLKIDARSYLFPSPLLSNNEKQGTGNPEFVVQTIVEPYASTHEGNLVRALGIPWQALIKHLERDWSQAFKLKPRFLEEVVAAAFDKEGYEVTLTPQSRDRGRDVIAVKSGLGCVRIVTSVKRYKAGRLVRYDDVRALAGVLLGDPRASKGMITTTSDFPPGIDSDPHIKPLMPYRLELMNGNALRNWLLKLAH